VIAYSDRQSSIIPGSSLTSSHFLPS